VLRYAVEVVLPRAAQLCLLHRSRRLKRCSVLQAGEAAGVTRQPRTVLRYAVEVVLPRAARLLGLLEPVLERVVYEDVPANLLALKHRVETLKAQRHVTQLDAQGASLAPKKAPHCPSLPSFQGRRHPDKPCRQDSVAQQDAEGSKHLAPCVDCARGSCSSAERAAETLKPEPYPRAGEHTRAAYWRRQLERPKSTALAADLQLLCGELRRCFGQLGYLPSRADLRAASR